MIVNNGKYISFVINQMLLGSSNLRLFVLINIDDLFLFMISNTSTMVVTHPYFWQVIIILLDVKDNSKGRMNEYNEDQKQSQCKDYFKDNFIVWKETL
jgi:hypothetical protein